MFRPDGREAPEWMPHDRESWLRLCDETPIFAGVFLDLATCPAGNPDCEWTLWDGDVHVDPPEWGYHSTGCREPYHCGWCDTSEAIADLHREMAQIDHDAWGCR